MLTILIHLKTLPIGATATKLNNLESTLKRLENHRNTVFSMTPWELDDAKNQEILMDLLQVSMIFMNQH